MKEDTAESRLKETLFIVEATSFEKHCLWLQFSNTSPNRLYPETPPVKWEQLDGFLITVGTYHTHPICISAQWDRINGELVMFWEATSNVVNHTIIKKWLNDNFKGKYDNGTRSAKSDAMNFGHCLQAIREKTISKNLQIIVELSEKVST